MKNEKWDSPWLWLPWTITGIAWVPMYLGFKLFKKEEPKWFRWWGNRVDNLVDWLKETLHGMHLPFGYELNIAFLMKNREEPYWPIIRKQGDYPNEDPEDLEGE